MTTPDYFEMNRAGWDRRAEVHFRSKFYDVEGFLAGATSLREIELAELPDVAGRRLLHLQCHFGLDTLSWARRGAICTGVDLSPVAIDQAKRLAARARIDAEFVRANVYDFRRGAAPPYDIVFTSYGTVCWLPDLARWAEVVASNLAPGGTFCMVDFHPIHDLLSGFPYFANPQPDVEESGTYTENGDEAVTTLASWAHPLSDVLTALPDAGVEIVRVREFPFSPYDCFEGLTEREPGRFFLQHRGHDVPMVYSVLGRTAAART